MAKRKKPSQTHRPAAKGHGGAAPGQLLEDLRALIRQTRAGVAQAVNSALVLLYWQVGHRIRTEILKEKRAGYGEEIVATVSRQLTVEFGRGFAEKSLRRMIQFAEVFPDEHIVAALSRQLGWSHFVEIIPLPNDLQRDFYAEMCRIERWSVRTLRAKVQSMLFQRTALSKKPAQLARKELDALRREDTLTPDLVFRDPYFLDSWAWPTPTARRTWRPPSSANCNSSSWSWVWASPSSTARSASSSTARTSTSICCSTTAGCVGSWLWTSRSASSRPPTRARWSCTCAGWKSTRCSREKSRPSA